MNQSEMTICPKCHKTISKQGRYCSECGWDLNKTITTGLSASDAVKLGGVAIAVWLIGWLTQHFLSGTPAQQIAAHMQPSAQNVRNNTASSGENNTKWQPSAPIQAALKSAEEAPQDLTKWRAAADLILSELDQSDNPPNELLFEAIDVLGRILKIAPKDTDALAAMANISFNQQALSKAVEYYERYLAIKKDDYEMRSNYGMALARLGRFDDGLKQIQQVLAKQPNDFTARGYLAVTYSMKGEKEKALKAGQDALAVSPNEEARARLSDFLSSVANASEASSAAQPDGHAGATAAVSKTDAIVSVVRDSQVAGPKMGHFELNASKELIIEMNDFPMDKMPPFVRQQFSEKIKAKLLEADSNEVATVKLVDSATKQILVAIDRSSK